MKRKSKTVALILSIMFGGWGVDRFYLGYIGMGILKLFTCGGFFILWIIDAVNIANGKLLPADGSPYEDDFVITSPSTTNSSNYRSIERLFSLKEQGILTEKEFNDRKTLLLGLDCGKNYIPTDSENALLCENLENLGRLKSQGLITQEEFEVKKRLLLAQ